MRRLLNIAVIAFVGLGANAAANDLPANFVKVSDGIYRGARPSEAGLKALARLGIKADINLQGGDLTNPIYGFIASYREPGEQPTAIAQEKISAHQNGLAFLHAPLDCFDPITRDENSSINQVLAVLERSSRQTPVYLHCEHGVDRTGMIIALYRVKHDKWTPQAAFDEWERLGHNKINQVMLGDLDAYFWAKVRTF